MLQNFLNFTFLIQFYIFIIKQIIKNILNIGFVDSFRATNIDLKSYTFWDYQNGAWQKDNGIRIDLFLISPEIVDNLIDVGIDKTPRGEEKPSDHTPIWIELNN